MTLLCVRHELHTVYEISTPSPFHCSDASHDPLNWSRSCGHTTHLLLFIRLFICRQSPSPYLVSLSKLCLLWLHAINQAPFLAASDNSPACSCWSSTTTN